MKWALPLWWRSQQMKRLHCALAAAVVAFTALAPRAKADEVTLALEPACPYGYYDAYPYSCAPYGYYGPEWFIGGVFVGAGPWFHGPRDFQGHVDNRFDVGHGYRGPLPTAGERRDEARHLDRIEDFRGSEMRDGRGFGAVHGR
jgi:hypothetical protein